MLLQAKYVQLAKYVHLVKYLQNYAKYIVAVHSMSKVCVLFGINSYV